MGKKVCALDLGSARVGVALSDDLRMFAHPHQMLPGKPEPALLDALARLVAEEGIERFVVGLPVDMRGGEGDAARRVRHFAQKLADRTACEIDLWDERLTTVQAKRALDASGVAGRKQRALIDNASACTILQAWLDQRPGL